MGSGPLRPCSLVCFHSGSPCTALAPVQRQGEPEKSGVAWEWDGGAAILPELAAGATVPVPPPKGQAGIGLPDLEAVSTLPADVWRRENIGASGSLSCLLTPWCAVHVCV